MEPTAMGQPHGARRRAWLEPSAIAEPQVKRQRSVQCPVSSAAPPQNPERHLYLDLSTLMLATDQADHVTKYALNGMDSARVRRVLQNPCRCTAGSNCSARQLLVTGVMEYCGRFHHLSQECQTHSMSTSYETCGPALEDKATPRTWVYRFACLPLQPSWV